MAGKQVQHRRGSTAQTAVFTGAVGEVTVDTDKKTVVVHDGVQAGGFPLARKTDSDTAAAAAATADAKAVAAQASANTGIANAATAQTQANLGVSKANTAQAEVDALETVVANNAALAVPRTSATGAAHIPIGDNAQRPVAPQEGDFRFNSQLTRFEGYQNGQWAQVGGDSLPVFFTTWWPNRAAVPAGFVVADGQLLTRATYPDASAGIVAGNVPTATDANWLATPSNRGRYTLGDGTTNFRLPDYNGKYVGSLGAMFLRGDGALSAGTNGAIQLDDFKAHVHALGANTAYNTGAGGSFWSGGSYGLANPGNSGSTGGTETRPLNVTGCWVIKLFGAVINPGSVDAAQLASDMANVTSKVNNCFNRTNSVGVVSQVAGAPTGALMEYVTNSGGQAWKYANGQMIATTTMSAGGGTAAANYVYKSLVLSQAAGMPHNFITAPLIIPCGFSAGAGGGWGSLQTYPSASLWGTWAVFTNVSVTGTMQVDLVAFGRWY